MPNISWDKVSISACHRLYSLRMVFYPQKWPPKVLSGSTSSPFIYFCQWVNLVRPCYAVRKIQERFTAYTQTVLSRNAEIEALIDKEDGDDIMTWLDSL
jgi:hypothetical protein